VEVGNVSPSDDSFDCHLLIIIPYSAVERFVRANVRLRLAPKECRKARLRIEINGQDSISAHSEVLRQMRGGGGLTRPTFEIHHRDNLKLLAASTMWQVAPVPAADLIHILPNHMDIFN
nr:ORF 5 [Agrobacterium tumefaciens]